MCDVRFTPNSGHSKWRWSKQKNIKIKNPDAPMGGARQCSGTRGPYPWHGAAPPQGQLTPLASLPAPWASRAAPACRVRWCGLGAKGCQLTPNTKGHWADS